MSTTVKKTKQNWGQEENLPSVHHLSLVVGNKGNIFPPPVPVE